MMAESYKVVRVQDLVDLPAFWQSGAAKEEQFARALEHALNGQAAEGWAFVATYGGVGSAYLIFRRLSAEASET